MQENFLKSMYQIDMKQRVKEIKKSTVRILINGQKFGTGFIISKDGLIATCFHVVQCVRPAQNDQLQGGYAKVIEVEFNNGNKLPATVHNLCQNQGLDEAISKDYCILEVNSKDLVPLPLGEFSDAVEGADIYLCGFPFNIIQPVVSTGILSTKWIRHGYLNQGSRREVAWLDITMNSGNSGGPVVLIRKEPRYDKVIGIAAYNMNPFAKHAKEVTQAFLESSTEIFFDEMNLKDLTGLVRNAIASNSLGVGACISIDYLKRRLMSKGLLQISQDDSKFQKIGK